MNKINLTNSRIDDYIRKAEGFAQPILNYLRSVVFKAYPDILEMIKWSFPLEAEFYTKSGLLLKRTTLSDVTKIGNRWYPKKINYKDIFKSGKGTDFIVNEITFDSKIPEYIFSKTSLKK